MRTFRASDSSPWSLRTPFRSAPNRTRVQERTERLGEDTVWGIAKRRFPSPPNPLSHKERGGTDRFLIRPISFRTWVRSAPKPYAGTLAGVGFLPFDGRIPH
jgi:hypothetical protein